MNPHKTETEAKFVVPNASVFAALRKITNLGDFELKPIGTHAVIDRYLDTADKHMYRAGFACRIRTVKEKQILTLKSLTPADGHLHRRQEIELEIETDQPQAWAESEAKRLVLEIVGTAPLQTLFVIHQTRHKFHTLLHGQLVIEFSLDEVSLNDAAIIDYYELEAELKETGAEADLAQFIEALQANWLLQPESLSKFERGLASISQQRGKGPE
jgi:inorganic triphosphatase YgiF